MTDRPTYSVLIVEDEEHAIDYLSGLLAQWNIFSDISIARNGAEALDLLRNKKFDIAFMDIDIPVMSGISVLQNIEQHPHVIFTTGFSEYAVKAFELNAVDFLVKPFNRERFNAALERALRAIEYRDFSRGIQPSSSISFREKDVYHVIPLNQILYISSFSRITIISTAQKDYQTLCSLNDIASKIDMTHFIRIHRNHMVKKEVISELKNIKSNQYIVVLNDHDETPLPVGRSYLGPLKKTLQMLKTGDQ
ncbi:MAG TPA: LytTR family DNA-binding domain-containing protein [Spirochaetota bacterium]|nr:LytTR family DNA-binding domain-containing protein [Spirochaetota bacterium]HPI89428.1 LytTR family DNA-binding domain-containing protein [Spirochaetota bacterium]HPR46904.1 LytTR family DNA-binding domain-containing protein [Spirochaetota bacterium]